MQYKSFIDYSKTMKVESPDSDSDEDRKSIIIEEQAPKGETKSAPRPSLDTRLTYPPNNAKGEREEGQGIKAQPKSELKVLKKELKVEKGLKKTLAYYGQSDKKKEI